MNEKQDCTTLVRCRRTEATFDVREHHRCPYCYGTDADVLTGDRSRFCDFDPEHDPINFGFPAESSRNERA